MEKIFIQNNPEEIISQTISFYQSKSGEILNAADAERILIDCMAYRETLLRGEADHLMRQNFVQYAAGVHLDNWGELFGVPRITNESDNDYRKRVLESNHASIGTVNAYRNTILSVPGVSDALIERKYDDNTLPPGVVRLTPIMMRTDSDMITFGVPHNAEIEAAINESVYVDDFGVIGAMFEYKKAVAIPINGTISIRPVIGYNAEQLKTAVKQKTTKYFAGLSLKFDNNFGVFDLERAIENTEGILSVDLIEFQNVPTKNAGEFYTMGTITINII